MANGSERIIDKLRKVLALTNSPEEGEAQAAVETLQRLLTEYNLSIADLEQRGATQSRPGVKEETHDLGKAAFNWKLDLAEAIAEHYYCHSIVDRMRKTVLFVGRPDNVESLQMLYAWIIDQIKRISSDERKKHQTETGEHIDPLRWQVNFGLGCVHRLGQRLRERAEAQAKASVDVTALVLSHKSEISDFMEQKYGMRIDGKLTQREEKWRKEREEERRVKEELKKTDIEAFYRAYPWERPLTAEEQVKHQKEMEAYWKKVERNAARRKGGSRSRRVDWAKEDQAYTANRVGRDSAEKVNLEPFIDKTAPERKELK